MLLAVFLPEAIRLIVRWFRHAYDHGLWRAITSHDPVELSLVAVVAFLALLAAYTVWLMIKPLRLSGSEVEPAAGSESSVGFERIEHHRGASSPPR